MVPKIGGGLNPNTEITTVVTCLHPRQALPVDRIHALHIRIPFLKTWIDTMMTDIVQILFKATEFVKILCSLSILLILYIF